MRLFTCDLSHRSLTMMMMMMMMMMVLMSDHFTTMTSAQSLCDPITQYEEGGRCCKKCPPGTSMTRQSTCLDPQCTECGKDEYQDKFTTEAKCQRQPYCDQNKNFQVFTQESKKKRVTCQCVEGFHCSSETCLTCVPHTTCEPGQGAQSIGNQTHDTVCQKCPEGSFSSSKSWSSVCSKWTECASGYHVQQSGTEVSDNICEKTSRQHIVMIILLVVTGIFICFFGLACYFCKGHLRGSKKICRKSCNGDQELGKENQANLIKFSPVDNIEKVPAFPEESSQEGDSILRTPEENEDEPSDDMLEDVTVTEKGNLWRQESGKTEINPQQESQTQTLIN